jgi:hypothetical protein
MDPVVLLALQHALGQVPAKPSSAQAPMRYAGDKRFLGPVKGTRNK